MHTTFAASAAWLSGISVEVFMATFLLRLGHSGTPLVAKVYGHVGDQPHRLHAQGRAEDR